MIGVFELKLNSVSWNGKAVLFFMGKWSCRTINGQVWMDVKWEGCVVNSPGRMLAMSLFYCALSFLFYCVFRSYYALCFRAPWVVGVQELWATIGTHAISHDEFIVINLNGDLIFCFIDDYNVCFHKTELVTFAIFGNVWSALTEIKLCSLAIFNFLLHSLRDLMPV